MTNQNIKHINRLAESYEDQQAEIDQNQNQILTKIEKLLPPNVRVRSYQTLSSAQKLNVVESLDDQSKKQLRKLDSEFKSNVNLLNRINYQRDAINKMREQLEQDLGKDYEERKQESLA
jgi:ABC-type branched-subunit amino acid transport system ATPase component